MADREALLRGAVTTFLRRGYYGLSFWTRPDSDAQHVVRAMAAATGSHPTGKMRSTTIGRLREAGFTIQDFTSNGHFNLTWPEGMPSDDTWVRLEALMAEPIVIELQTQEEAPDV